MVCLNRLTKLNLEVLMLIYQFFIDKSCLPSTMSLDKDAKNRGCLFVKNHLSMAAKLKDKPDQYILSHCHHIQVPHYYLILAKLSHSSLTSRVMNNPFNPFKLGYFDSSLCKDVFILQLYMSGIFMCLL